MRAVFAILLAAGTVAASEPAADLFAFFRPSVVVSGKARQLLESGAPVVSVLDTDGRAIAVFSAMALPGHVTSDRMIAWLANVVELRKSAYVLAVRRFSNPPRPEDLEGLSLDEDDLSDIRNCRPGDCGVKLSSAEIDELQRLIRASRQQWKPAVQAAFHRIVFQRMQAYSANGHAGLADYRDRERPRSPAVAFSGVVQQSDFLSAHAPGIASSLSTESRPAGPPAHEFLYWSKERMGGKAVVSATHVSIFRGNGRSVPEVLMIGKQIFATHYLDASLGVTALVRDPRTGQAYFVYVNRSDVDLLEGIWASFARRYIESRLRSDGPAVLREVGRRVAASDPPPPSADR